MEEIIDPTLLIDGGRISEVFYGEDGLVRSAKIRTSQGIYDRPIVKLCRLPIFDQNCSRNKVGGNIETEDQH